MMFLVLLVTFTCFCITVSFGPIRITGGVGGGNKTVPKVHSNEPAVRCVGEVLGEVALMNTLLMTLVTMFPVVMGVVAGCFRTATNLFATLTFDNSSVVVIINITLRAAHRLRTRVSLHGCGNFLSWFLAMGENGACRFGARKYSQYKGERAIYGSLQGVRCSHHVGKQCTPHYNRKKGYGKHCHGILCKYKWTYSQQDHGEGCWELSVVKRLQGQVCPQ